MHIVDFVYISVNTAYSVAAAKKLLTPQAAYGIILVNNFTRDENFTRLVFRGKEMLI